MFEGAIINQLKSKTPEELKQLLADVLKHLDAAQLRAAADVLTAELRTR